MACIEVQAAGPDKIFEAQRTGIESDQDIVIGYLLHGDRVTDLTLDTVEKLLSVLGELSADHFEKVRRIKAANIEAVVQDQDVG